MYGMINQGIKDLVVAKFGEEKWLKICKGANSPIEFVPMQYYPDPITYSLIGTAAEILSLPPESILEEFGRHWVLYTAKEGYGDLMDLFGKDFKSCLMNLNHLHARMGTTMTKLSPPRFTFKEVNSITYWLDYHSTRKGLDSLVLGLVFGLIIKYEIKAHVERVQMIENQFSRFVITLE